MNVAHIMLLSHFSDGEMYSASQYELRSNPDIRRNFPFPNLKTEETPIRWLQGNRQDIQYMTPNHF